MLTIFFGKKYDLEYLRHISFLQRDGALFGGLSRILKKLGIKSIEVKGNFQELISEVPLPAIAHWEGIHFIVIFKVVIGYVSDPAYGGIKYTHNEIISKWAEAEAEQNLLLLVKANQHFQDNEPPGT